jgi:hypothetical protein
MGLRWVQWQQAVLIVAPFILLLTYVVSIYVFVNRRSLRSTLRRLILAAAAFTLIWVGLDSALFFLAWIGTSDVAIEYDVRMATYRATIGLPFEFFREAFGQLGIPTWLSLPIRVLPPSISLLLVGALTAMAQRLLASTRFSIERHLKQYAMALTTIPLLTLAVLLWPQPSRNPEMPSVPIPDDAVAVTYGYSADGYHWPVTTFGRSNGSVREVLDYYHNALQVGGWTLELSEAHQESGPGSGRALYYLNGTVLELKVTSAHSTYVSILQRGARPEEVAEPAVIADPTAMHTLVPAPSPELTQIAPVPTIDFNFPATITPRPNLPASQSTLVADQVIRQPIASGDYVFWISVQPNKSVYGYQISQKRSFQITTKSGMDIYSLASDGKTVAWAEGYCCVRGYDIANGVEFPIVDVGPDRAIGEAGGLTGIALDNGVLYYADAVVEPATGGWVEGGIHAHDLTTGVETKLIEHGYRPVVRDGVLLWSQHARGGAVELHALRLDGSRSDTILSSGLGLRGFSGYDVSGDYAAWAGFGPEARVYIYDLVTSRRTELPSPGGLSPLVHGNKVVWTEEVNGGMSGGLQSNWSIRQYDIHTGNSLLVSREFTDYAQATALTGQGSMVYIAGAVYRQLYLLSATKEH